MKIGVIVNDSFNRTELLQGLPDQTELQWMNEPGVIQNADGYIDFTFEKTNEKIEKLKSLQSEIIIVNELYHSAATLPENFVKINGWPGFFDRKLTEASCSGNKIKSKAEKILSALGKRIVWTTDQPGFIAARVICMIINEAYLVLEEDISTKRDIDIALKLGTNYPYGPFEWGEKIGLHNVYRLLEALSATDKKYNPASSLKKEALQ
jgi:3-hydroxybutyryl-CoA dehydrogenase